MIVEVSEVEKSNWKIFSHPFFSELVNKLNFCILPFYWCRVKYSELTRIFLPCICAVAVDDVVRLVKYETISTALMWIRRKVALDHKISKQTRKMEEHTSLRMCGVKQNRIANWITSRTEQCIGVSVWWYERAFETWTWKRFRSVCYHIYPP